MQNNAIFFRPHSFYFFFSFRYVSWEGELWSRYYFLLRVVCELRPSELPLPLMLLLFLLFFWALYVNGYGVGTRNVPSHIFFPHLVPSSRVHIALVRERLVYTCIHTKIHHHTVNKKRWKKKIREARDVDTEFFFFAFFTTVDLSGVRRMC